MSAQRAETAYRKQVDRLVAAQIQRGVPTFDDLVYALPGVYPTQVYDSVSRLREIGVISPEQHRTVTERRHAEASRLGPTPPPFLPPPHPLDFDWRYSVATINHLLDRAVGATQSGDTVVLLGTPTLHVAQLSRELDRRFVLIDANPAIVERVRKVDARVAPFTNGISSSIRCQRSTPPLSSPTHPGTTSTSRPSSGQRRSALALTPPSS